MLPGFRFLVAAIVFSMSVLVFGLGAAALLRAAHEQFASNASWRAMPAMSLTTFLPQPESPPPTLAMLRVEPSTPQQVMPTPIQPEIETSTASVETQVSAPSVPDASAVAIEIASPAPKPGVTSAAPPALTTAASEPDIATAAPAPSSPAVAPVAIAKRDGADVDVDGTASAKPDIAERVTPDIGNSDTAIVPQAVNAAMPATTAIPERHGAPTASFTEAQILAGADIVTGDSPSRSQLATAATTAPKPDAIALKIASLGDQPASTRAASIRIASVQLHQSLAKKRLAKERLAKERLVQARRAKQQRQMALRARAARQTAAAQQQQQYADPFAQPQAFGQQQAAVQRTR
jgi:hypothetical protein